MNWNSLKAGTLPELTGAYTVSVKRRKINGEYVFNYLAWFDCETGRWSKHDPFSDEDNQHGEDISHLVTGWASEDSVTFG